MFEGLNREVNELISRISAVRNYSKSFIADLREPLPVPPELPAAIKELTSRLNRSISSLSSRNLSAAPPCVRISSYVESTKVKLDFEATPLRTGKADLLLRDLIL